jgi:vacuolar protein sorting-associated protein 18
MIHNLLLTLLISSPSPSASDNARDGSTSPLLNTTRLPEADLPLLRFLSTVPSDPLTNEPYYDLDYALRLCKQHGRLQACVHIYAKMGMWEESVDLALEMGELDLAKVNADRPEDDEVLRKKLWSKVARYVVQDKKDIKTYVFLLPVSMAES